MKPASNSQINHMKRFWKDTPIEPQFRELNAKLLKGDFLSLIARLEKEGNDAVCFRERLQAIIDWCDIATKNADEFDSHGVRNLTGPVFEAARAALEIPSTPKPTNIE